ncbi:hypothetical protein LRS06_15050 [Hymenobacter sp. J193]|uniref:hypothetical protein n=1 Tax=Hymenobacter sp. J193 TaxID=2898429 RepID=UPI002151042B|nr:hypothetical protein [Hymenobacter sp. J193]MCR5889062.1 hypothetical protein [Hymenobacter sp. J193]
MDHGTNHAARLEAANHALGNSINHGHLSGSEIMEALDAWQHTSSGGLNTNVENLRSQLQNGDKLAAAHTLQQLGEEASQSALNLHDGLGDQLRHLGQLLVTAAGNMKMS